MNRLFVTKKPIFISSNSHISRLRRKYRTKKMGYSGTLDPFATGVLITATGQYTKLFRFLKKAPKEYKATLWLGAISPTLDIEKVSQIEEIEELELDSIKKALESLIGDIEYLPPKYSAKKIAGKRACDLAREGKSIELKSIKSTIYDIELLNYSHPFLHFRVVVSEGSYIRSIAQILADRLGVVGSLSSLERVREGEFIYEDEMELNPIQYLNCPPNRYLGDQEDIILGRKLSKDSFEIQDNGIYYLLTKNYLSIIEIADDGVKYLLNQIKICSSE